MGERESNFVWKVNEILMPESRPSSTLNPTLQKEYVEYAEPEGVNSPFAALDERLQYNYY